jgi:hypothetical protein
MAVVAAAVALVVGSLFLVGSASAQPVTSGSFSLTSDPDDPIALGQSFSYGTTAGDQMEVDGAADRHSVDVEINGTDGNDWHLGLFAPEGEALVPGTYQDTTGEGAPGISIWRPSYFCWGLGSFTINKIEWGPYWYVRAFDATVDFHCWGEEPGLRATVHILNPPPPPVLKVGVTVAGHGTVSTPNGSATVHGTVRCSKDAFVDITGTIAQKRQGQRIQAEYSQEIACTRGTRMAWTATATPPAGATFHKGSAHTRTQASGFDSYYEYSIKADDATVISLTKQTS